jgi:hypothetical protein
MSSNTHRKRAGKVATNNEAPLWVHTQEKTLRRCLIYTESTKVKAFLKVSRRIKNDNRRYIRVV